MALWTTDKGKLSTPKLSAERRTMKKKHKKNKKGSKPEMGREKDMPMMKPYKPNKEHKKMMDDYMRSTRGGKH